jgi:hypothetical protein
MIYLHLALLLHSLIISSLCNAMNESDHHLPLVGSFSTKEKFSNETVLIRSFSTKERIFGIGFPTNDTILTRHHYEWSTFCLKTGEQKINIENEQHITDFDLNKDGKIAIVDSDNLTVHDIKTGTIIYKKAMSGLKMVAFCSNNDTLGVYNYILGFNYIRGFITIHTIEKDEEKEEKYNTPYMYVVKQTLFAGNPTNKEFIIGNQIVKCVTGDKDAKTTGLPGIVTNILSNSYNPDGTVIAINKRTDGYLFHRRDSQDFVINSSKNSDKKNEKTPYYSIAFHPKKRFAALLTYDNSNHNSIEFWDYIKKTEKPLAIIGLPSKDKQSAYFYGSRLTAFAPNGKKLVVIVGGNTFYIMPTPKTAYYNDTTKVQCIAFNWAIKNRPDLPFIFIPQDIVKLITHKLSRVPDFQLPKPITQ